jgi:uncharacterized protein
MPQRYDYQPAKHSVERTPEGFLRVRARATKTGVLNYTFDDGRVVKEYRPPEEVFKAESMSSLALRPVTNNHPAALLDSDSATLYTVGFTGSSVEKADDKFLEVDTMITCKKTINDAESGKVEVSAGYVCELDFTPGKTPDGEPYDAIQRNIRYNHLAVVKSGRCGPDVRLRLDAGDAIQSDLHYSKEKPSMKVQLNGKEFEVTEEVGTAIRAELDKEKTATTAAETKADVAEKALTSTVKEKETLAAKADGLEAEITKLKTRLDSSGGEKIAERVKARVAMEKIAEKVGVEKFDSLSDLDLKKAVIVKHDAAAEAAIKDKSEAYIDARFDVTSELVRASDEKAGTIGSRMTHRKTEVTDSVAARQKMIERQKNAWKNEKAKEA